MRDRAHHHSTPTDALSWSDKEGLGGARINVPIVADIHFNPQAALTAAEFADKVRSIQELHGFAPVRNS
jgi:hypothetical protein